MSGLRGLAIAGLVGTLSGCQPAVALDHYWSHDHCTATLQTAAGQVETSSATAYLRRENGSSGLVIQLDSFAIGINDPYPSGPVIRFAVPRDVKAPDTLEVVRDASDVRGPLVIAPGKAWLITTPRVDTSKAGDDWRFGTGSIQVTAIALHENDTSSRDFVSFDASFDLSGVQATGLAADATPAPVAGTVHVTCADDLASGDAGAGLDAAPPEGGLDAAPDGASDASDAGDAGATACGQSNSCANPTCGDCNGNPADFCETDLRSVDHCGACTRACGSGSSCDALGACVGTQVASEAATAVAIDAPGIGYLVAGAPGAVRFVPNGAAAGDVVTGYQISANDAVRLAGNDLWFASYGGIARATVPGGAVAGVLGSVQPDSMRLVGLGPTYAYVVTIGEGSPPRDVVRRIDRATSAVDLVACAASGVYDAAVDIPSGSVFVSTGTTIQRYSGTLAGSTCTSTTTGTPVVTGQTTEAIPRVAAGSSRLVWIAAGGTSGSVRSLDLAGTGVPTTLGQVASGPGARFALAVAGDTAFWVDAAPLGTAPARWRIVSSDGSGPAVPLAVTADGVTSLAADATDVAWADATGVFRVAR